MKKCLLHICCGVCSLSVVKRLREEGFQIIGFFYNPNIWPYEEYLKRLEVAKKVADMMKFPFIEAEYDVYRWQEAIRGKEKEPEGGERCRICFEFRLKRTFEEFKNRDADFFTTTLTVSPYKNATLINSIGRNISSFFLERDFKKKDGFKISMQLAKKYGFYRQNYCGCIYSLRSKNESSNSKSKKS